VNSAESSLRKCIRPLASWLRLQPGHDEICTCCSQLNGSGKMPAFGCRAYDTSINSLVISPRTSQTVWAFYAAVGSLRS
jgi:hypothetical protein